MGNVTGNPYSPVLDPYTYEAYESGYDSGFESAEAAADAEWSQQLHRQLLEFKLEHDADYLAYYELIQAGDASGLIRKLHSDVQARTGRVITNWEVEDDFKKHTER